jgi:hypothetical protein
MFDPLAITVDDLAALGRWDAALTQLGVLHSPIVDAVRGWLIVIQDPDGNRIRLYTLEFPRPRGQAHHRQPIAGGVTREQTQRPAPLDVGMASGRLTRSVGGANRC